MRAGECWREGEGLRGQPGAKLGLRAAKCILTGR